ncbi:hypothetical protein Tco_0773161 [Tanacetum coccineum]|uniref:MAK10-like protein n=1 Tax=Tanacetum coccineum TaxID=301880 RepID=A0ABQ4ZK29_9ASTR
MGDENPIRTLGDYSKPSHEGYRNTIKLLIGNTVVPLRSDTIWTAKLCNDILMFQEHHEESLSEAWTVSRTYYKKSLIMASTFGSNGPHDTQYCMEDPNKPLLNTHPRVPMKRVKQSDSYDEKAKENEEEEKESPENIHVNPSTPPDPSVAFITEKVLRFNSFFKSLGLVPQSSDTEVVCTKGGDGEVMFIELIRKIDDSSEGEHEEEGSTTTEGIHIIMEGCPSNLKIPCNIGHVHVEKAYIDPNSPLNIMTQMMYNWIMRRKLDPRENSNRGVSNFTRRIKGMHVFVGNFTYIVDFMIVEDISSIIDPRLSQVVLGKPFVEISSMTHDPPEGVVRFTNETDEVAYKMPHMIEQYNSPPDLEKEHTKSVYLRNKED